MNRRLMILDAIKHYKELSEAYSAFKKETRSRDSLGFDTEELIYTTKTGSFLGALKNLAPQIPFNRITQKRIEEALEQREPLLLLVAGLLKYKLPSMPVKVPATIFTEPDFLDDNWERLRLLYQASDSNPNLLPEYEKRRSLLYFDLQVKLGATVFQNYHCFQLLDACLSAGKTLNDFLRVVKV